MRYGARRVGWPAMVTAALSAAAAAAVAVGGRRKKAESEMRARGWSRRMLGMIKCALARHSRVVAQRGLAAQTSGDARLRSLHVAAMLYCRSATKDRTGWPSEPQTEPDDAI